MGTLTKFAAEPFLLPVSTAWYLSDLGEFRGKEALYTRQSQRLKVLREHAMIESAVSSNRIEGVSADPGRVRDILLAPKPLFRDRDEEEIRGYRDALAWIHGESARIALDEAAICRLHGLVRGQIWDAGRFKEKDIDIIERYPDGRERIRFRPVPASDAPAALAGLVRDWRRCLEECRVPPLIALAAFNLDFLCIHPFRDGNGRVSRLLWLLQSYQLGYEPGRYVSLERLIEQNKARYYETLEQSSQGWHEGRHDPWPYINYVLFILKTAYREFAERMGETKAPRGAKTEQVLAAIGQFASAFSVAQLERACPGVSRDMVRRVLREQQAADRIECLGRGPAAKWRRKGNKP
jgi:Fic family protein